ncbi:DUF1254 domain-containing protein [Pseudomonas sp. N040]|uniref:DUF1254 domain-containing protein n=1 Tax=Pseudomonas sp. N040 TaxID=2785325 RepID=UPI0018A24FE8|nr:DUF1254 domain-containing protein [Pseudomonas sp. N040]MBF7730936.1 DUF1254 domain-containing protein [Pseudomonas sp. N040]MBW7014579.1 DUF1254 domain-containing protein [Pseudomonas sp. N040]
MPIKKTLQLSAITLAALSATSLQTTLAGELSASEAQQIATDAYVYGYSLVTTDVTRIQMSNVDKAEGLHAPLGQFINIKRYPPGDYRGVSAPNADTLYSAGWIDLSEPQVFSHPDMGNRYFLFPMYDLWMSILQSPGSRTTGGKAGNFLLTGPDWKGEVPKGMTHYRFGSRYMLILGRTYADGTDADYAAVNALQAQYKITPLSAWGKPYTPVAPAVDANPGISMSDKPQAVILAMGTEGYFNWLSQRMCKDAPAYAADAPTLGRFARIGFAPCKPFELAKLDPAVQAALKDLPKTALDTIGANQKSLGTVVDGWQITKGLGQYGTDYMKRAVVAAFGWPANLQEDAVYPYTTIDADGQTLTGANNYTITFAKGQLPPANGFWSFTMYMIDQGWWFVPNALNKFTVSPRDNLKTNVDGSTTLYFQRESPGKDKESNWLPAPQGEFIPMLRMYWPKEKNPSILDGSWMPPQIVRVR